MVQQGWDRRPYVPGSSPAFSRHIGMRFRNGANFNGCEFILYDLSDRELMDIGTTRGEIDYVALNQGIDPRGNPSAG